MLAENTITVYFYITSFNVANLMKFVKTEENRVHIQQDFFLKQLLNEKL